MSRPGITADQRDAMAVAMQHSVEMQKEVYDRRTVSDKGKSGSALVAQLFQEDMAADSADDSDTEEDLISDLEWIVLWLLNPDWNRQQAYNLHANSK